MNQIQVKLGEYDFDETGESSDSLYNLVAMRMHENYDTQTFENDIAILKLDRPVQFNKSIWPICLPPRGADYTNRRAFVIGMKYSL